MDMLRPPFLKTGEHRADVSFFGNPNIMLVSWLQMPLYEADFGWGKPHYFGPGAVAPIDDGIIAPSPHGHGSILIFMHFQMAHLHKFINLFWDTLQYPGNPIAFPGIPSSKI
ncbi:hypothetical protein PIB30_105446 [Stylosanthes scabra]|uniref:Uncharacterized protein n=1 Tax=Stylosanthes scabra TaxID=79078 RepID=A0ABU6RZ06_9FABA|nr:hypothetical protein [Stylosanthes scabra]